MQTTDYKTIARPVHVMQEPRYIVLYWPVPGETANADGHSLHSTLTFEHDNGSFRAVESTALASVPGDGTIRIDLQISARPARSVLASVPAARFSAPRFKAFVQSILG